MYSCLKAPFISQLLFPPLQLWKVLLHRFPCFLHCVFHFRVFIELIQIIQIKLDHLVHGTLFREMSVRIAIVAIIFVLATVRFFSKSSVVYRHTATLTKFFFHLFLLDYKFMLQDKCK